MSDTPFSDGNKKVIDQYGNRHFLTKELARGGQGVVYRTKDADLAVKQPLSADGEPDRNTKLKDRFQSVRCLPLPPRIPISLPLSILRDEPGYVMQLLSEMEPFGAFELNGEQKADLANKVLPAWLQEVPDKGMALTLLHYAQTGSTRRRLFALYKCAAILARLHAAGLVYGDISPNNCFMGEGSSREVWLIDADNLRYETVSGGNAVYTPRYGAPEIVRGSDCSRPRTDCWAFAVMAFETLSLVHPFIGRKVLDPDDDEGGWDADPVADGAPADLDEQAYAGFLPFVDDEDDDSNEAITGLPRQLVSSPQLTMLFQETFGAGRTKPWRRPMMAFWTQALARAYDDSLVCPICNMSYFSEAEKCPYCDESHPAFVRIATPQWSAVVQSGSSEIVLPHRFFNPFSFELSDRTEYEAVLDFDSRTVVPVRGTNRFPENLSFEFIGGKR